MRSLLDGLICTLVTLFMFAFPMTLLGFAPWFGDSVIGFLRLHPDGSLVATLKVVLLMTASSGVLCLLTLPAFALVYRPLAALARFGDRLMSGGRPAAPLAPPTMTRPMRAAAPIPPKARMPAPPAAAVRPARIHPDVRRGGASGLRPPAPGTIQEREGGSR